MRRRVPGLLALLAVSLLAAPPPDDGRTLTDGGGARETVVLFGDSITEGWPAADPAFFASGRYVACGVSGQTTGQMLARFAADVVLQKPAVVVILAGTNDVAENAGPTPPEVTQRNLEAMTDLARAHGIRVVLASILPAADFPWRRGLAPAPKIEALDRWIREYAGRNGLVYLDYHAAMADGSGGLRGELGDDGVHPNAAGYAVMRPLAEDAIRRALAGEAPRSPGELLDPAPR